MMKMFATAAVLALTLVGASATASHAGYWTTFCNGYVCWNEYVPTCGYNYYGWYVCG